MKQYQLLSYQLSEKLSLKDMFLHYNKNEGSGKILRYFGLEEYLPINLY